MYMKRQLNSVCGLHNKKTNNTLIEDCLFMDTSILSWQIFE